MGPLFAVGRLSCFAGRSTSYVDLDDETLTARMGRVRIKIQRENIGAVTSEEWRYFFFSGWRVSWALDYAVFGAPGRVVHIETLEPRYSFGLFFPVLIRELYLGVEDVDGLIKAIGPRPHPRRVTKPRSRGWVPLQ